MCGCVHACMCVCVCVYIILFGELLNAGPGDTFAIEVFNDQIPQEFIETINYPSALLPNPKT